MLAKRTYKNQITIPKGVMKEFQSVEYFDVQVINKEIVLKPVFFHSAGEDLELIRTQMAKLGVTEKEIAEAVRWSRRQEM